MGTNSTSSLSDCVRFNDGLNLAATGGVIINLLGTNSSGCCMGTWKDGLIRCTSEGRISSLAFSSASSYRGGIPSGLTDISLSIMDVRNVSGNSYSGPLPSFLKLRKLEYVRIDSPGINGTLPPGSSSLVRLKSLKLHGDFHGSLPSDFGNLPLLTELNIIGTQISGQIPQELGKLSNLLQLHLIYNKLLGAIPPQLGALSNLSRMNVTNNMFNGKIPEELGQLSNLSSLDISYNNFTGMIPNGFPELTIM
ncbi:hypothetical protein HDU67_006958 [Dinochytrium kinnereticum]|nr:hypothetical protein HDU67_006958 [Dinochytrium kinnereticum]